MDLPIFQIDAFIRRDTTMLSGNPAAVVPLREWLTDEQMQAIAAENNLSETTFFVKQDDGRYFLRWFTPETEVDLCGHATLAAAHVIHQILEDDRPELPLTCGVGDIPVAVIDDNGVAYELNFPACAPEAVTGKRLLNQVSRALGKPVKSLHQSRDLIAVLESEDDVLNCSPDQSQIAALDVFALAITARSNSEERDFVSRFFAPKQGIAEDPVTGSSFCSLGPLWAGLLEKEALSARQSSRRGGDIDLKVTAETVFIRGRTYHYMQGVIRIPD